MIKSFATLFDIDGVLVDSVAMNWGAYNRILEQYDIHIDDGEISKYLGMKIKDQIDAISADYKSDIEFDNFMNKLTIILPKQIKKLKPQPGVANLLKTLSFNDIPIIAATSLPRDLMITKLTAAGLLNYFDDFVSADDVTKHKPNPEVFLKAAKKSTVSNASCVVFEDAPSGVAAAINGGFKVIAIKTPYVDEHLLEKADLVLDSLESLDINVISDLLTDGN